MIISSTMGIETSEILFQKLGPSLTELFSNKLISINEAGACKLLVQVINRLQLLHELGYAHGNVSFDSLCIDEKELPNIFLTDFYYA